MIDEPFPAAFNCRRALGQLVDERKQTPDQNRLAGKMVKQLQLSA